MAKRRGLLWRIWERFEEWAGLPSSCAWWCGCGYNEAHPICRRVPLDRPFPTWACTYRRCVYSLLNQDCGYTPKRVYRLWKKEAKERARQEGR